MVRDKVEKLIERLKEGLNGVHFPDLEISDRQETVDDMISDGFTKEESEAWADDYVTINIYADIPEVDGPYVSFDASEFYYDLRNLFVEYLGEENLDKDNHFSVDVHGGDIEVYNRDEYEKKWSKVFSRG